MKKEFTNKRTIARRTSFARLGWQKPLLVAFVILFCGTGFYVYQHKKTSLQASIVSTYASRFTTWLAERKNHLNKHAVKPKQLANDNSEAEDQIHFEFYSALPNMRVTVSDSTKTIHSR